MDFIIKSKKRILIYDPISRTGGGLAYIKNILPYLKNNASIEYVLYCNRSIKQDIEHITHDIKIIYSPKGSEGGGLKAFRQRKKISRDEILNINPHIVLYMNQIPVDLDIPSILFLRNALYFLKPEKNYYGPLSLYDNLRSSILRLITSNSIKKSDLILTSSKSFAYQLSDWYKNRIKITTIPFGTNKITEKCQTATSESRDNLLVLQYNFYKGVETAVYALEKAYKVNPQLHLTITDNLKDHKDKRARALWEYIKKSNVKDRITCTGTLSQEKLKDVYAETDLFLFPSFVESFGHGVLEAMNNGIPTILSDIPVFREIAGDAAVYFRPGSASELSEKIVMFSENLNLKKEIVKKGFSVVTKYSWEQHAKILSETVLEMVKDKE